MIDLTGGFVIKLAATYLANLKLAKLNVAYFVLLRDLSISVRDVYVKKSSHPARFARQIFEFRSASLH